jgi:hypothetical protein
MAPLSFYLPPPPGGNARAGVGAMATLVVEA